MSSLENKLSGVLSVICTPFDDSGDVDKESINRLVDHQLAWGVDGIVVFGLAGELYKLTDDDRRQVLSTVFKRVGSTVPVVVGTEHTGTEGAIARSREAADMGASALMLYPPTFVKPDGEGVVDYFVSVGTSVELPIIVQDAPQWTGVPLSVELLTKIVSDSPNVRLVKVEAPPASAKIRALRRRGFDVIGGFGALHLIEDLRAGVQAIMPGCALPGLYRDLWSSHQHGNFEQLWGDFARVLPLLSFQMSSLDVFVAVQKQLLHQMGVLSSAAMRRPGAQLDSESLKWLDEIVDRTEVGRYLGLPTQTDLLTENADPSLAAIGKGKEITR
jgi:2-keto-3-deoxy-L-arabinonate dehydratase